MTPNIGCAVQGCNNPVIGQCTGYKGSCGRYYCAAHSSGTLCVNCADRKFKDESDQKRREEYLPIAQSIQRQSSPWIETIPILLGSMVVSLWLPAILVILAGILLQFFSNGSNATGILICPAILFGAAMLFGINWWYSEVIVANRGIARAAEVAKTKPGFLEFYKEWRTAGRFAGLAMIGVVLAAFLAGTAKQSEEDARVRKAVDDELKRRGQ